MDKQFLPDGPSAAQPVLKIKYRTVVFLTRMAGDVPLLGMIYFLHTSPTGEGDLSALISNAGLWLGFAILHSGLARPRAKRILGRIVHSDYVRVTFVGLSGLSLTTLLVLWRPLAGELWHTTGWLNWLLTALFLAAIASAVATTRYIDYLDFLGLRALKRRITSKARRPPEFSARGPFAYVRHPMYLALIAILSLLGMSFDSEGAVLRFLLRRTGNRIAVVPT